MAQKKPVEYIINSKLNTSVELNNKNYLYFGGAGYYILQSNPEMIEAAVKAVTEFGIGSASSRTLTGTTNLLIKLENDIADFFGTQGAVYLPSGYLTNIAAYQALDQLGLYDIVFIDSKSHYCNADGAKIQRKKIVEFLHCDIDDLKIKIKKHCKKGLKPLIASDGVFPVNGDLAQVNEYLKLAEQYNGIVWIDDSHGVGILGESGRGTFEHFNLKSNRIYMGGTLSKAFGAYGGFIVGNYDFIKTVRTGNVLTGSSSPPNAAVAAGIKGIELIKKNPAWRKNLWENATYLKNELQKAGISTQHKCIPIVSFNVGNSDRMQKIQEEIMEAGIFIQFIKYIGSGDSGTLRIVVNAFHSKEDINQLLKQLKQTLGQESQNLKTS